MSHAVHAPSCIKGKGIPECITNYKCIQKALIPKVPWNNGWNHCIEESGQKLVVSEIKQKTELSVFQV